jgi:hypothetical protein
MNLSVNIHKIRYISEGPGGIDYNALLSPIISDLRQPNITHLVWLHKQALPTHHFTHPKTDVLNG